MSQENILYYYEADTGLWRDMWQYYGVAMGDGFLAALYTPAGMKDYVEGQSRLEHGKTIITANARTASREVTLSFNIHGTSEDDFHTKRDAFYALLYKGAFTLRVAYKQSSREDTFHLVYKKSTTYDQSRSRRVCTVAAKFEEPNIMNRE